jgi:hypothetical protein
VVGKLEGLGLNLVGVFAAHHCLKDGLIFGVRVELEVVVADEVLGWPLAGPGVGFVHPEEVKLSVQEDKGV